MAFDFLAASETLGNTWQDAFARQEARNEIMPGLRNWFDTQTGVRPSQAISPTTTPSSRGLTREQAGAYLGYRRLGLPHSGASSLIANLSGESGPGLDPNAMNNSGTDAGGIINPKGAFGVAQWNGPRQEQLLNFSRQAGLDPSDREAQLKFTAWDLQNNYPDLWNQLKDPNSDPKANLQRIVAEYERPADVPGEVSKRAAYLSAGYPQDQIRLAGSLPLPDTAQIAQGSPQAAAVPPITQPMQQTPYGQPSPRPSSEILFRALQNPHTAAIGAALLQSQLKSGDATIVEVPAADEQGNFIGSRKAIFNPHSGQQPVPFGPVDTSKVRDKLHVVGQNLVDESGKVIFKAPEQTEPAAALDADAERYRQTGTLPPNMGRGVQGAAMAASIRQRAVEKEIEAGGDPSKWPSKWQDYKTGQVSLNRFMSGTQGDTVRSFNVLVSHLYTLENAVGALKNGDIQLFNRIANAWAAQTGDPAPTNFDTVKNIVGDEVVKAVIGSRGGALALGDRQEIKKTIDKAESPAQLIGAISKYRELAGGQLRGLEQQYKMSTKRDDFSDLLLPETADFFRTTAPTSSKGREAILPAGKKTTIDGFSIERVE